MLNDADKLYKELCVELGQYKTNFDSEIKKINITKDAENVNEIILKITELKVGYMQIIFKIADTINDIYEKQRVYAISVKALLEELKKNYINIIKYYETPVLALKCIEYDIVNMNALIDEDTNNPYSVSYYKNYKYFKEFYKNQLYKNKQIFLEPKINFADETEIYINNSNVLLIEREQYELYDFKIFLSYSHNQFDIWILLFKSIELGTSIRKIYK
jgi:hypothetical protein